VTVREIDGVPLMMFGDELEWVVAIDHIEPQVMAAAAEDLLEDAFGETVHIPAGTVQLRWGIWDDGNLIWDGVGADTPDALRITVVAVGS
jgi:hypothetical protein